MDTSSSAVVARAPGRVNLIGEHTDYNGGRCLPFALDLGTTVRIARRADERLSAQSDAADTGRWEARTSDLAPGATDGWAGYVAGVLWALEAAGVRLPGMDLEITSDLPLGGGLSSSAALECAVAVGVSALVGADLSREQLAEVCRRAETEYVGAPTGGLDQLASMLGSEEHGVLVDFADPDAPTARSVPMPLQEADLVLLVTDSRVRHSLADGDGGYAQRRRECEDAARALGVQLLAEATAEDLARTELPPALAARARHVITEQQRVSEAVEALEQGAWTTLGALMDASHESLRHDFEVTVPATDLAVDAARSAGALGARMTGGGFGGSTVALVRAADLDAVQEAIDVAFAAEALRPPTHHAVVPAAGARVLSRG
ncbi:galactokinase [Nocardioides sp.]|uniref:galactokinase n=1 Tax=Nocardioides sp. TaxID=35761 RepID=UPI0035172102